MAKNFYNWQRYWCPRDASYNLQDGGYLSDPKGEWGAAVNPYLMAFEGVAQSPCLVLLGEPGIGKTRAVEMNWETIQAQARAAGHDVLWIDLRTGDTEERLIKKIFENSIFRTWLEGSNFLFLFLDSLGECLLRVSTVAALLKEELKTYSVDRLRLRIACRTAEWPALLEDDLIKQWGEKAVQVLELAPLRRADVSLAAEARGIKPSEFLDAVQNAEAVPLAIKPVTLEFLLNTYSQAGSLPSTQVELYELGCRLLCGEPSESRNASRATGNLSADQRMMVAGRIAILTLLCSRYAVYTEADQGAVPPGTLPVREIAWGIEPTSHGSFAVTEDAVQETLGTGLFSARGAGLLGWSHQTYAEFLAAWYLRQKQVPQDQILSLIQHPGDAGEHLVPQLEELAAWIVGMTPGIFRKIMDTDPAVLLRSDIATADTADCEKLVAKLLEKAAEGLLHDRWMFDHRPRFYKLKHPHLPDQLRSIIADCSRNPDERTLAIRIAEACRCGELQDELATVALDAADVLPVRIHAAYAVQQIGDQLTRARLRPLAYGDAGEDPDDDLKGCGLQALWPDALTVDELFPLLKRPKKSNLYGLYQAFLETDLTAKLQVFDLPVALRWAAQHQADHHQIAALDKLAWQITKLGWEKMNEPDILEPLAATILNRIRQHIVLPSDGVEDEPTPSQHLKRRQLLKAILAGANISNIDLHFMVYLSPPLAMPADISWLIQQAKETSNPETEYLYAQLVGRTFSYGDRENWEVVIQASQSGGALTEVLASRFAAIPLDSPIAQEWRELAQNEEQQRSQQVHTLVTPPPAELIAQRLHQFENGIMDAWWLLNLDLTLRPGSKRYGPEHAFDLTQEPGWQAADDQTKLRILAAAEKYLLLQDPEPDRWFGTSHPLRPALAGYRALHLLLSEQPEALSKLPVQTWTKWIPIILSFPLYAFNENNEQHLLMVGKAFRIDPTTVVEVLLKIIDAQIAKGEAIVAVNMMAYCWEPALALALLEKAKEDGLTPGNVSVLLGEVLRRGEPELIVVRDEARKFATALIAAFTADPASPEARLMAVAAAHELMLYAADAGWPEVWAAIQRDVDFGRALLEAVASRDRLRGQVAPHLTEEQAGDLFLWLAAQYPYAEDPQHEGVYEVDLRDQIMQWRDSLLIGLERRGTPAAVFALHRVSTARPDLLWLQAVLLRAQENTRRVTWSPLRPDQVLRLTSDSSLRFVQSGHQLLQVVTESLMRLQKKLIGETPMAQFLWSNMPDGKTYRSKDEEAFSDYVKDHLVGDLKNRGIVVNREVQIRKGHGATRGEDTDIHVDAVIPGEGSNVSDRITLLIESKGCWHAELGSAMRTQLVDRYLKDNLCRQGLYLIGWFRSTAWDQADTRWSRTPKITFVEAQDKFRDQAVQLSVEDLKVAAFVLDVPL